MVIVAEQLVAFSLFAGALPLVAGNRHRTTTSPPPTVYQHGPDFRVSHGMMAYAPTHPKNVFTLTTCVDSAAQLATTGTPVMNVARSVATAVAAETKYTAVCRPNFGTSIDRSVNDEFMSDFCSENVDSLLGGVCEETVFRCTDFEKNRAGNVRFTPSLSDKVSHVMTPTQSFVAVAHCPGTHKIGRLNFLMTQTGTVCLAAFKRLPYRARSD